MLQWNNGDWEHRAYWGANTITYWGVDGTNSRRYMGALPATGGWVRLEVPAASVGLVGNTINGMAFTLIGGKATWDRAGKTAVTGGGINKDKYTVDATNNRFTELAYDVVGNVTKEKQIGLNRMEYKYDGNNHVIAAGLNIVSTTATPTSSYGYDADGKRTRKIVGTIKTWFVYGIDGELVAEYNVNGAVGSPQKEYGYRGGQLLVVYDPNDPDGRKLQWLVADHLGTPRMTIDLSGRLADDPATTTIKEGIKRHDYLPFGEEIGANVGIRSAGNGYTADQIKQKFTGKERDVETGLDFFEARYFASVQGRFTGVDPYNTITESVNKKQFESYLSQPQNWNRYTYTWNNPLRFIDPTGETVYSVFYTKGNSDLHGGDADFKRAAETRADEIRHMKGYDPKKDTVVLKGVVSKADLANELKNLAGLEKEFGKVGSVSIYSHSGADGPIFHGGLSENDSDQYQFTPSQVSQLSINWEKGANAYFYGCNSAQFARLFAQAQCVTSWGYEKYAYFSLFADKMVPASENARLEYGKLGIVTGTYLIAADYGKHNGRDAQVRYLLGVGRVYPMVRKDSAKPH